VGLLTWFFEDALNTRLQKKNAMTASSFACRPQGDAADHGRVGCFFTKKGIDWHDLYALRQDVNALTRLA
jgi:hypothetical protein